MRVSCVVNKTCILIFLCLLWDQCYCDISSVSPSFETKGNDKPIQDAKSDHISVAYKEPKIAVENLVVHDNEGRVNVDANGKLKIEHEKYENKDSNENSKVIPAKLSEEASNHEILSSHIHEGASPNDGGRTAGSFVEAISTNDSLPKPVEIQKKIKVHGIKPNLDVHGSISAEEPISHEAQPNSLPKQPNDAKLKEKKSTIITKAVEEEQVNDESASSHQELPKSQTEDVAFLSATAESGHHTHSEAMPSFDEWKKMMLAEQSKDGLKVPSPGPPGKKITSQKRKRNYASYECGAKIVGSNPEAEGTSRILNELFDEYMLNPCKAKIWFVIELCEAVQALQIELANFELFSSCPKDFAVYSSDHYPTRDWTPLGTFQALEQRVLQSFQLKQEGFGKFIKIELLSYYGKEHYCPLSVVRMFGTSMVDEYEEMETAGIVPIAQQDDDDDREVRLDFGMEHSGSTNLFGSATDAVLNIVKKAAQVLGRDQSTEGKSDSAKIGEQQNVSETKTCKYFPDSSESCSIVNGTTEESLPDSTLTPDAQLPYSSLHHTLFHYLHHCDSCVSTSQEPHQSMAQPTCRFFEAALGPVAFQGVCDFLKDHPITSLTPDSHVSGDRLEGQASSETIVKPPQSRSPPPTIISVIIDGPKESKSFPVHNDDISVSDLPNISEMSVSRPEMSHSAVPTVEGNLDDSELEEHRIKPTKTSQGVDKDVFLESSSNLVTDTSQMESQSTPDTGLHPSKNDAEITSSAVDSSSVSPIDKSSLLTDSSTVEAFDPSSETPSTTSSDQFLESGSNKSNDTAAEINTKFEDITELPVETAIQSPDDFVEDMKIVDEKISDIPKEDREMASKLDPAISGSALPTVGQKESVFMRMSNRIKALELNMSLSSQYLQELSQRYRRQMEEMQRAFNRTIGTLNDTARKAAERDVKQQEVLGSLQSQVANLTLTVELLMTERNALYTKMIEAHVFLMIVEAIVMITILSLCVRRMSSLPCSQHAQERDSVVHSARSLMKRRNSAEMSALPICTKLIKRSASEEILLSEQELLIVEPTLPVLKDPPLKVKKKYPRRRNKNLPRSVSNPSLALKKSNPTPSLQHKEDEVDDSCSASALVSHSRPRSLPEKVHVCENCNISATGKCTLSGANCNRVQDKEKRTRSSPFQNLTNGAVCNPVEAEDLRKDTDSRDDRRFSLKKFLKIQKRDSV